MKLFLSLLMLLVLAASVHAAVTINASQILPATAHTGDSIAGICTVIEANTTNITYSTQWFKAGALNTSTTVNSVPCFQESANVSTACGGLATGKYFRGVGPVILEGLDANITDGNYTSSYNASAGQFIFYVNLTKPPSALGAIWTLNFSTTLTNVSVSQACINPTVKMRVDLNAPLADQLRLRCYDQSDAIVELGTYNFSQQFSEEAIFWNMTTTTDVPLNQSLPYTVRKGEQWIFSCQANNSTQTSDWLNSSALTVANTAPVNTWSANNYTFTHNVSLIFGDHCTDIDEETITFFSNNTFFPLLANGSINWTSNVTRAGVYDVTINCSDGTVNATSVTTVNVTNTPPNATSTFLTPLPAQAGTTLNLTYTCTDADNDVCNATVFYAWFKNGQLNSTITGNTFGSGNFTTGDNITGSVRVFDGNLNSTWLNTSTATVGDTTPPSLTSFGISPTSTTTAGTINVSADCTDNNQVGTVYAEVTDALGVKANFSMTNITSSLYSYNYPPPIGGTYSVRVFCTDGNGNVANTTSLVFTVTTAPTGSSGGGGGPSVIVTGGDDCEFSIVRPTNGFVNTLCRTGQTSANFSFVLQNDEATAKTYTTTFKGVDCQIDSSTFTVLGKSQHEGIISACTCPSNVSQEGSIQITTETCTGSLPIKLYNGVFSRIIFDQEFLIKFMIGFFIVAVIAAGIILARS